MSLCSLASIKTDHFSSIPQCTFSPLPFVSSCSEVIFERVIKNPFFGALVLTVGMVSIIVISAVALPPLSALGVLAVAVTTLFLFYFIQSEPTKKWLLCEGSLMFTTLASTLLPASTKRPWYSKINDQLTLGANPLKTHIESLKQQGHTAILSMLEPFETEPHLFGVPAKPEDWRREGLVFFNLPNPDFTSVRIEDIERGVEFLHRQISQGGRVYVHCQAGVGRSATIVICYLIKYQRMSPADAAAFVSSKRTIAINENSPAIRTFVQTR
jgi:protein-tyrosine phosphatase